MQSTSTKPITITPTQWSQFSDIDQVQPVDEIDLDCLNELKAVLKKHGKQNRFGIALLHKHFDLQDDEMLVEFTNFKERKLEIRPVKKTSVSNVVETIWQISDDYSRESGVSLVCQRYCGADIHGNHAPYHAL